MHDTLTMALSLEGDALLDGDDIDTHELARILRAQADRIEAGDLDHVLGDSFSAEQAPVRDVNGNTVGAWTYRPHMTAEEWQATPFVGDDAAGEPAPNAGPQVQADPWNLWLGDINAVPWADLLDALPSICEHSQTADLKVEATIGDTQLRVWLSRCDVASGEPFARTVYVEALSDLHEGWDDVGYYDGDKQGLRPGPHWAAEALNITRQLCQPDPEQ